MRYTVTPKEKPDNYYSQLYCMSMKNSQRRPYTQLDKKEKRRTPYPEIRQPKAPTEDPHTTYDLIHYSTLAQTTSSAQ